MIDALNPLSATYWGERIPEIKSSRDIYNILDAKAKAAKMDFSDPLWRRLIEGSTLIQGGLRAIWFVGATPFQLALVPIFALGQLLREIPHNALKDQPRVFLRTFCVFLDDVDRVISQVWVKMTRFTHVFTRLQVSTENRPGLSTASVFTHKDVNASALKFLYGWLPTEWLSGKLTFKHAANPGICLGESLWALALFHEAEGKCPDTEVRLRTIARQYRTGASPEALLIQQIHIRDCMRNPLLAYVDVFAIIKLVGQIFRMIVQGVWNYLVVRKPHEWRIFPPRLADEMGRISYKHAHAHGMLRNLAGVRYLTNLRARNVQTFEKAKTKGWDLGRFFFRSYKGFEGMAHVGEGSYLVLSSGGRGGHAMAYVKEKGTGHFFDPNFGLERHEGPDHWKKVVKSLDRVRHSKLMLIKMEKRDLLDRVFWDLPERLVELRS